MTKLEYLENTYKFEGEAEIIETGENEFGKYIILDKTIFYPQGGGQPSDIGEIIFGDEIFEVENVRLDLNGIVFHYGKCRGTPCGYPEKGTKIKLKINLQNRIKNAKNHTAGHLLDIATQNIGLCLIAKKGFYPKGTSFGVHLILDVMLNILEYIMLKKKKKFWLN